MGHIKDRIVVEADEDTSFEKKPRLSFINQELHPEGGVVIQQDGRCGLLTVLGNDRNEKGKKKSKLMQGSEAGLYINTM